MRKRDDRQVRGGEEKDDARTWRERKKAVMRLETNILMKATGGKDRRRMKRKRNEETGRQRR